MPPANKESPPPLNKSKLVVGWIVILGLLTLVFVNWEKQYINPNQQPQIRVNQQGLNELILKRNRYGHYVTNGFINNQSVTFLLDTGATFVAVPENLAKKLGLIKQGRSFASTANGVVDVFNTRISQLQIGNIVIENVRATINPGLNHDNQILLGMSVLKDIEFTQRGDKLTLSYSSSL